MGRLIYKYKSNLSAKLDAFTYQQAAFEAVKDLNYAAIFHEQGLGKTKIAIDILLYWLEKCDIDTVIIVTKKQLVKNWENEFAVHTYLKPQVLTSNKKNNFYVFNSPARVVITNFETISGEKNRVELFLKSRNTAIIIDESTKIKNPESKLTRDFFELASLFKRRVIMTGTPVANRPYDIWAQIFFLDLGNSLGDDFIAFKKNTDLSNEMTEDDVAREKFEKTVASIYQKIRTFSVRETKNSGIISLPDKIYINVYCDFEVKQMQMYNQLQSEMQLLVEKNDVAILDDSEACLKRLLRFIQITSNPRLIDDLYGAFSGKEVQLDSLLNEIIVNRKERVIVWSSFIENINYFYKKYRTYSPTRIHGGISIDERNNSVEKFKTGQSWVLFATPQAAKEGLTLTIANNVIFYDRGFNLDDYLQAQDRIHRISQTKPCYVYNLMIKDSIDIWVDKLLQAKQNAAILAQGDYKLAQYQEIMDYSYGDLIKEILNKSY